MKVIIIKIVYFFCRFFYKKEYMQGRLFSAGHFTEGWKIACRYWFVQRIIGVNRSVPWPCSPMVKIGEWRNIEFSMDDLDNFTSPGTYFQAINAKLVIGRGTKIAPGVGLITANHSFENLETNAGGQDIIIGRKCWIGMNAIILPGVILGDNTIVGAGAVVTKSFEGGNCILVGNPAYKVRDNIIDEKA